MSFSKNPSLSSIAKQAMEISQAMAARIRQNMFNERQGQTPQQSPQNFTFTQDVSGVQPVFQDIGNQQMMQRKAMQDAINLSQQANQRPQGMNPMMMASLLRRPNQQQINASNVQMGGLRTFNPFTQFTVSRQFGTNPYSQQSRMIAAQEQGF